VYRHAPRSHAYNCPCNRCVQVRGRNKGNYGIIGPGLLILGIGWIVLCWPALAWHGQTDTGGWRWDIHSTVACLIWWGIIVVPLAVAAGIDVNRKRKLTGTPQPGVQAISKARAKPPEPLIPRPPDTPICLHHGAVRVESVLDWDVTWHCWCPDCDPDGKTPLPADFRYPCCGGEPGTEPGTGHLYNCPNRKARQ
jgi:hypothetical protein